jgi:hypothetical protein
MNPSESDVLRSIKLGLLAEVLRGEKYVFGTPAHINDDMRPTDHAELLERGLYPVTRILGASHVQTELEVALRNICRDALGVYCAHQCFYIQILHEAGNISPFLIDRQSLPKYLADRFMKESSALHSLEVRPGDLANDGAYKVTLSGMRILKRDHGIEWGIILP